MMDAERAREFLLELPHVVETMQWGANLLFWVGDKAIGGKMYALIHLEGVGTGVCWFSAGPEHYAELVEIEGIIPAPYMARAHWVTIERWDVLRPSQWREELKAAHARVLEKLPPKTKKLLELPQKERAALIQKRNTQEDKKPEDIKQESKEKESRKKKPAAKKIAAKSSRK